MADRATTAIELRIALRVRDDSSRFEQFWTEVFSRLQPAGIREASVALWWRDFLQSPVTADHRRFHPGPTADLLRYQSAARSADRQTDDCRTAARFHCEESHLP